MSDLSRSEFGDFLRSRRAKLTPKSVGLPSGRRRRAPGLRREEVAELAGIGVDWYVRLEQGRAVSPSVTTIDALAHLAKWSIRICVRSHRPPIGVLLPEKSFQQPFKALSSP